MAESLNTRDYEEYLKMKSQHTRGEWTPTPFEVQSLRLIAAAPAMYEALKDCLTSMRSSVTFEGSEYLNGAIAVATMAIAKAEGK